jgi:hypothetical protein
MKIQVSLKSDKNKAYFTPIANYIYDTISLISHKEKILRQKLSTKSKPAFYIQLLLSENRALPEIMWKNMVYSKRPQKQI